MEDVDLLDHRCQDVVEAGQPQLGGQGLDNVQDLARKIKTDQHPVAGPHLSQAVREPLVSLRRLSPHSVVLSVCERSRGERGGAHQVAEERDAGEDHLAEHWLLAHVRLHVQLALEVGLTQLPELGELYAHPLGQILDKQDIVGHPIRVIWRREHCPYLARWTATAHGPGEGRGGPQCRGGVKRGVLVLAVVHGLEGEPVLGLHTLPSRVTLNLQLGQTADELLLLLDGEVALPELGAQQAPHLLHALLRLGQVGLEQGLFAVAVQRPRPLVLLDHPIVILLSQVAPNVGREMEQELEPVEHHQRVPGLVRLVLSAEDVEEHLVRLVFALGHSCLHLLGGICAILSVVNLVPLLDRAQGVQLVHDAVGVGLDEGQLVLVMARHLPPQVLKTRLEVIKGGCVMVLQQEVSGVKSLGPNVSVGLREHFLQLLLGEVGG